MDKNEQKWSKVDQSGEASSSVSRSTTRAMLSLGMKNGFIRGPKWAKVGQIGQKWSKKWTKEGQSVEVSSRVSKSTTRAMLSLGIKKWVKKRVKVNQRGPKSSKVVQSRV